MEEVDIYCVLVTGSSFPCSLRIGVSSALLMVTQPGRGQRADQSGAASEGRLGLPEPQLDRSLVHQTAPWYRGVCAI
jgi:hypothetical protein